MSALFMKSICIICLCGMSVGQAKDQPSKRVILPSIKLVRCMTSECFQLLQQDPPRPGDVYPEHIDVAFLDRWCPFGLDATYNKAVPLEDLTSALEKLYGKGTAKNWTDAPLMIWHIESDTLLIQLDVADKRMAQSRHVEEGARTIHYSDISGKICPVR